MSGASVKESMPELHAWRLRLSLLEYGWLCDLVSDEGVSTDVSIIRVMWRCYGRAMMARMI